MAKVYMDSCMIIGLIEGDTTQRRILKTQLCNLTAVDWAVLDALP